MISCANYARKLYRPSFITKAEIVYHELLRYLAEEIARVGYVGKRPDLIQLAWLMGLYEVLCPCTLAVAIVDRTGCHG